MSRAELNRFSWISFGYKSKTIPLPPIFELLLDLYNGKDVVEGLESCRINPDFTSDMYLRNDLEYYIPQFTNFMGFHQDFLCQKLTTFLEEVSRADPYFAHSYYWHINSLIPAISKEKGQHILDVIVKKCSEEPRTQLFVTEYANFLLALHKKLTPEEYEEDIMELQARKAQAERIIQSYRDEEWNNNLSESNEFQIRGIDLDLKPYVLSDLHSEKNEVINLRLVVSNPFTAALLFFNDLSIMADVVITSSHRLEYLNKAIGLVNKSLPSCVYIPFVKDFARYYAILGIVAEETKVFATKERAPFYLCFELFRPQEELAYEYNELFHPEENKKETKEKFIDWAKKTLYLDKLLPFGNDSGEESLEDEDELFNINKINEIISSPRILKKMQSEQEGITPTNGANNQNLLNESFYKGNFIEIPEQENIEDFETPIQKSSFPDDSNPLRKLSADKFQGICIMDIDEGTKSFYDSSLKKKENKPKLIKSSSQPPIILDDDLIQTDLHLKNDLNQRLWDNDEHDENDGEDVLSSCTLSQEEIVDIFGEDSKDQAERIRHNSPFKHLKTWRLLHVIVKKGADMKEEQFATQLISQFDQIFKAEGLKLKLTPYEIVSLGSDFGLVEMVKDAITLSRMKEKMYHQGISTLNEFFIKYYGNQVEKARKRFCRSLAAYSVVCYFLQIKDRHNGNIMFHKEGHIFHIDFGFFLSNSPGKGIEFERRVPFKLLNEYIDVLGGTRSSLFQEFRKLFYQGFMAARKHREQILILVKMMYSSQGKNLPCFKTEIKIKGIKSITELEQRFCPNNVDENNLKEYCYNLINQSLDNWRAKCYDKYQYHFQGIFY